MADELDINANHVLFIVKGLAENIQAYCGYGPDRVDPEVLMSMLGEAAHFVQRLMPAQAGVSQGHPTGEPRGAAN